MPKTENTSEYSHLFDPEFDDGSTDEQRGEVRDNPTDNRSRETYQIPKPPTKEQIAAAAILGFDLTQQDKYFPNQAAKRDREE